MEAKRDLYEKLIRSQAELDIINENKLRAMYEWEERKIVKEAIEKRTSK